MERPSVNKWLVALTVLLPTVMELVDTTIVTVSLPNIQGALCVGVEEITWVLTSYLVSNAFIIPISGWLAGIFGRKRYLIFSIALFTFSSFMCGIANTLFTLVLFRLLQGLAGGGLQPLSLAILLESFPPKERGMAMAIFMMGVVLAPILGPVLGGWLTDNWGWRWIFYVNLPLGIISLVLTALFIFDPTYIKRRITTIDYRGLLFLAIGLGCLQVVLDKGELKDWFNSQYIIVLSLISATALVSFVINETMTKEPIVNLRVFKDRSFSIGCLTQFTGFFAFFGSVVLLTLYVQRLMGYTAFLAGVVFGPAAVINLLIFPIVGRLIRFVDARYLLSFGILGNALALYLMAHFNLEVGFWNIVWLRVIQAVGLAFFFVPLATVTFIEIKKEEIGNATAVYNLLRNLGASFGTSVVATILSRRAQFHQSRLTEHLTPSDLSFQQYYEGLRHILPSGFHTIGAIYNELLRQALMMAFNDAFFFCGVLFILLLSSLIVLKKAKGLSA